MSCYQVDAGHIDALLHAAMHGPTGPGGVPITRWEGVAWEAPGRGYLRIGPDLRTCDELDRLGQVLADQAALSVAERYGEPAEHWCYSYWAPRCELSHVDVVKLVHGYRYGACEARAWVGTEAELFCRALLDAVTGCLPGYDDAPWGITRSDLAARRADAGGVARRVV
jgi:hypothetical protein